MVYTPEYNTHLYYDVYQYTCYLIFLYALPLSLLITLNAYLIGAIKYSKRKHRELTVTGNHKVLHGNQRALQRNHGGMHGLRYQSTYNRPSQVSSHHEANATLVLIIIVLIFIICETPELIFRVITVIARHVNDVDAVFSKTFRRVFTTVSETLMVCASSVNFFIYCAFGRRFRRVMKMTFSPNGSSVTNQT